MRRLFIILCLVACVIAALAQTPPAEGAKPKGSPRPTPIPSASPTENPLDRIATLQQTVKDNPNDIQAREELGVLLVETGKPSDGRDQLENAIRLGATDAQAWYFIGVADRELSDIPDATAAFEKAELADPGNTAVLAALEDAYLSSNRLDDAQKIANRAIALHPDDAFGYLALGTVQLERNQLDQARASLNKALTITPKDARAHIVLGRSYLGDKGGNPDLAIAQFDIVLADDPKNIDALHAKAEALARKNDVAGSVAVLQQVVKIQPDSVTPEDDIAELYLSKHMVDQARQEFALAIKDHPKASEPYLLQGEFDQSEKRYQQAATEFESALALSPDDPRALFEYARLQLVFLKNPSKAADAYNKILAKDPTNPDALFLLAQAYELQGKWAPARDNYRKAFDVTHAYAPLFRLGVMFLNLRDYRSARDAFEALAVHQDPKHPDAQVWLQLGNADRMLGDKQNAVAAYTRYLALVPKGDDANKARAYIKQLTQ